MVYAKMSIKCLQNDDSKTILTFEIKQNFTCISPSLSTTSLQINEFMILKHLSVAVTDDNIKPDRQTMCNPKVPLQEPKETNKRPIRTPIVV